MTYHDVLARERSRVWDAALHVRTTRNLVAQSHCNMAEKRGVEEPVVAVFRGVFIVEVVLIVRVVVVQF